MVQRAFIVPPSSQIGAIDAQERAEVMKTSIVAGVYEKAVDRESAYEKLKGRVAPSATSNPASTDDGQAWGNSAHPNANSRQSSSQDQAQGQQQAPAQSGGGIGDAIGGMFGNLFGGSGVRRRDNVAETLVKSAVRTIGSQVGREIIRGVLGSIMKKR